MDAAGGEIRTGSEAFAKSQLADPKETLLHIAAKNGNLELVEWLDSHSKWLTAFTSPFGDPKSVPNRFGA